MQIRTIVSLEDLKAVPVPEQTASYKPVSHESLVDLTLEASDKNGFMLRKENYFAAEGGKIVTAYYDFNFGDDPEIGLRIAFQNSYNKKVSLKYAIGINVFVCENGAFSGDMGAFKKKHVGEVQTVTPSSVHEYFQKAGDNYSLMLLNKKFLRKIELNKKAAAAIVGDMYFNKGLLKETQIAEVKRQMEKPTFDYKAAGTAWELYNHITHALKTVHPTDYIDSHIAVNDYFTKRFKIYG